MRVLVVDDSVAFRTQIKRALEAIPGVEVVATASNGRVALRMIEQHRVELMTLDLNMPDMDGLQLLKELGAKQRPDLKIIIFAGRTRQSARDTFRALSLGARDFVLKPESATLDFDNARQQIVSELLPKVRQFLPTAAPMVAELDDKASAATRVEALAPRLSLDHFLPAAVVIASSTGGPGALECLFSQLKGPLRVPVLIVQHMPETFTKFLAARLQELSGCECREGVDGEVVRPGVVYVAPGDWHMRVTSGDALPRIALDRTDKVNGVRPAADLLFESAAACYGKQCMAFVLTGMGEDGRLGAVRIKQSGGRVMIQDRESSVVWGMPGSVFASQAFDQMASLNECGAVLVRMCSSLRSAS